MITIITNLRDYNDEENNEIFSFCESNELTFKVYDYDNKNNLDLEIFIKGLIEKKNKFIIIEDEVLNFSDFYETIEKRLFSKQIHFSCFSCGTKLENVSLGLKKCFECLMNKNEILLKSSPDHGGFLCKNNIDEKIGKKSVNVLFNNIKMRRNNFMEKLQLKKVDYENELQILIKGNSNNSEVNNSLELN